MLLHGMAGFVSAGSAPFELAYFAGVVDALANAGETAVFVTHAAPFASSWQRAHEIMAQLEEIRRRTGKDKLHLVAHSQGGLDAHLLASARYGTFVACIPADHMDEIGQLAEADLGLQPFDHVTFYRPLVRQLRTMVF